MKQCIAPALACAVAFVSVCAPAQEESEEAEKKETDATATVAAKNPGNPFHQLLKVARIDAGLVEVKRGPDDDWTPCEDGKYYPNGASFRTVRADPENKECPPPSAVFEFGKDCLLIVTNEAEFATSAVEIGGKARTVIPRAGLLHFDLPRTLPVGALSVCTKYFRLRDLAGESLVDYRALADGDEAVVRVLTGQLALEGEHYKVAKMAAANQVRIRTTQDDLFTSLRCESGTYSVELSQGTVREKDFVAGTTQDVNKTLAYELSPRCAVKIFRTRSSASGKWVVDVMTFAANGDMQNHRAFAEERYNVNSGELVLKQADAEAAKAAAQAAEKEASKESSEGGEAKAEDDSETSKENTTEE